MLPELSFVPGAIGDFPPEEIYLEDSMTTPTDATFEGWAVVELLGHRRLSGQAREVELFASKVLRLDVALPEGRTWPQFYTASAIFALTPTTADRITDAARRENQATLVRLDLAPEGERADYEAWSQEERRRQMEEYVARRPPMLPGWHGDVEVDDDDK